MSCSSQRITTERCPRGAACDSAGVWLTISIIVLPGLAAAGIVMPAADSSYRFCNLGGDHIQPARVGGAQDFLGSCHLCVAAVGHYQKAISLHVGFVLDDTVFRDANAVKRRAKRAQSTHQDRALDGRNNSGCEVTEHEHKADKRQGHEHT